MGWWDVFLKDKPVSNPPVTPPTTTPTTPTTPTVPLSSYFVVSAGNQLFNNPELGIIVAINGSSSEPPVVASHIYTLASGAQIANANMGVIVSIRTSS